MRSTLPSHPSNGWLRRRSARLLAGTTLAITGCLAIAVPAHAAVSNAIAPAAVAAASLGSASTVSGVTHPAAVRSAAMHSADAPAAVPAGVAMQTLDVSAKIPAPKLVEETYAAVAPNVPQLLQRAAPQTDATTLASTSSALGATPGQRLKIVGTALSYLGTPYVLGGASRSGIDCSGLTMDAYAAVGINLVHGVIAQNAAGHVISESDAKPGDLVVFDSGAHVALYLGNGLIVAAREPGTLVQIEPLTKWSGIGYHFTRLLAD